MRLKLLTDYKALLRLGGPVLVTQLGIIVVSFADTMMVGAYGTEPLAAAAFVNSVFMVPLVMLMGFAAGMTPLIGALFGRSNMEEAGATFRRGIRLNAMLSALFTLIMGVVYFFIPYMGQPSELLPIIRPYYLIVLATMVPLALFNCCQQTSNATTDTAMPMWIILGGNVLNIIGNWLLIFGHGPFPEMGLAGAGISTLTARWAMCGAIFAAIRLRPRYARLRAGARLGAGGNSARTIWTTSYPVMVQNGVECALWSFGAVVCGWFGALQLAGYQVVNTIGQLGFMIYMSFGVAVAIRTANFTGTGDREGLRRSARAGLNIIVTLATLASAFFLTGASWLLGRFTDDPLVVASGMPLIIPLVLYQYCDAIQLTYSNALRGTSYVKPLLWVSLFSYILVGIPFLLLLAVGLDMRNVGVYYSFSLALLMAAVLLRFYFRRALARVGAPESPLKV